MPEFKRLTVCVESPYKGKNGAEYYRNKRYALAAMIHAIQHDATPYLSHLLIPMVLNDRIETDRDLGISVGLDMGDQLSQRWFYLDFGWSVGMTLAYERAAEIGQTTHTFNLGKNWISDPQFKPRPTVIE